ncbi:hypothetical protein BUALT_Bualt02G0154800 [Buddleja alternifolia]|uniref:GRF-type domain-containing protein n=1 Tax=Buddleja alternifolia TaxID=168488 RepID=A0AAV6Y0I6_9LAMI|nr:hypothetical protein BUALT_Bualt02G0154800 [Buddleja alternifolia]
MSASSSSTTTSKGSKHECHCKKVVVIRTSWTKKNPGRRFYACEIGKCSFFDWEDDPMCARSMVIIPGLLAKINKLEGDLAKINKLEEEIATMRKKEFKLKKKDEEIKRLGKKKNMYLMLLIITWTLVMLKNWL